MSLLPLALSFSSHGVAPPPPSAAAWLLPVTSPLCCQLLLPPFPTRAEQGHRPTKAGCGEASPSPNGRGAASSGRRAPLLLLPSWRADGQGHKAHVRSRLYGGSDWLDATRPRVAGMRLGRGVDQRCRRGAAVASSPGCARRRPRRALPGTRDSGRGELRRARAMAATASFAGPVGQRPRRARPGYVRRQLRRAPPDARDGGRGQPRA